MMIIDWCNSTLAMTIQPFLIFGALAMKLTISQIQDLNEYPDQDKDPDDAAAEAYHQEMMNFVYYIYNILNSVKYSIVV